MNIDLRHGDCLEILKDIPDNSVDSVVTDPPYGLSFMGKRWDYEVPSVEVWVECLRVLKPGGHLLSFAGSRTYHRMAVNIEDAGFEIRDQIMWVYGSGFPKSHNISKAIDKAAGAEPEAQQWDGWGTALKPAHEPIVLARKPLIGTIVENVLEHGTGGLNIDACRIEAGEDHAKNTNRKSVKSHWGNAEGAESVAHSAGRFPANFIHDGSDEVVNLFVDSAARFFYCAKASKSERNLGLENLPKMEAKTTVGLNSPKMREQRGRQPQETMRANHHPTVKPIALMQYLCRLVTPKNGVVLDPFMGSGTTGIAAKDCGYGFIGIEREEDYMEIAKHRIWNVRFDQDKPLVHEWL